MSLLALAWLLFDKPMQRRYGVRSRTTCGRSPSRRAGSKSCYSGLSARAGSQFQSKGIVGRNGFHAGDSRTQAAATPEVHCSPNRNFHVVVTRAGGGYNRWRDLAVTRSREKMLRAIATAAFCYVAQGDQIVASFGPQPGNPRLKTSYEAIFTEARAEFRRRDNQIESYTQMSVSPEDDIEIRRITLTNRSESPRKIEVTSYAEVVLATQSQDESHPAFRSVFEPNGTVSSGYLLHTSPTLDPKSVPLGCTHDDSTRRNAG